jgi:hypothetical protein
MLWLDELFKYESLGYSLIALNAFIEFVLLCMFLLLRGLAMVLAVYETRKASRLGSGADLSLRMRSLGPSSYPTTIGGIFECFLNRSQTYHGGKNFSGQSLISQMALRVVAESSLPPLYYSGKILSKVVGWYILFVSLLTQQLNLS